MLHNVRGLQVSQLNNKSVSQSVIGDMQESPTVAFGCNETTLNKEAKYIYKNMLSTFQ